MIKIKEFEYETKFKSNFSPKPETLHIKKQRILQKVDDKNKKEKVLKEEKNTDLNSEFAEKTQKQEEKQENLGLMVTNSVNYEIKDVTPRRFFRRKKDV